jgi:surface protein
MEEIEILCEEIEEIILEDTREVVTVEKPVYPELEDLTITPTAEEQVFNHENSYGYDEVRVEAVSSETLEISPTTENQEFDGLYGNVKVNAVTNEIDSNIVPENIKNDVEILGVKGSFAGEKYKPRYVSSFAFKNYDGTELDYEVANLDTSNLTSFSSMFSSCSKLIALDLSGWNTINLLSMRQMFSGCEKLTHLVVKDFYISRVTNIEGVFLNCYSLTSLDLSGWDTSNVTMTRQMFAQCRSLTSLDLSNFDTSNVTNMDNMFSGCRSLTKLNIRNFTFNKVNYYSNMFEEIPINCEIIVKGQTEKEWVLARRSDLTNVKTVAELGE